MNPSNRPPDSLPVEFLLEIGRIATNRQTLERTLKAFMYPFQRQITGNLHRVLCSVRTLAPQCLPHHPRLGRLLELLETADRARRRANQVVHAAWAISIPEQKVTIIELRMALPDEYAIAKGEEITLTDLQNAADALAVAAFDLAGIQSSLMVEQHWGTP
jgi:hypothetical protein